MNQTSQKRYLTKSRFKLGLECPTKLYYTRKKEYANKSLDDSFLEALAQGGYQVGELAKHYYPGGHDIKTLDYGKALEKTEQLLLQDKVVIYEAAIRYQNLFIRIDILVKNGSHLDLIEVKAKSFDPENANFMKQGGVGLKSGWAPYLHDVAFQRFVLANAFPDMKIESFLMLVNKRAKSATDGLNTKFKIVKSGDNRKEIEVSDTLCEEDLNPPLLSLVNVREPLSYIYEVETFGDRSFESHIGYLSKVYSDDTRIQGDIGKICKKCEFTCLAEQEQSGLKSGFKECWKTALGWQDSDFDDPLVIDLWNFRQADNLIGQGKYKLKDLDEDDIGVSGDAKSGLSTSQRQWLQVERVTNQDKSINLELDGLREEMQSWRYPLHFIDFETTSTALPFTAGRSPYEGLAFQFSHHIAHKDGRVEHAGEFLDTTIGHFPSFDFIKEFKRQLENDDGTIFRYSNHENTYLNLIYRQLRGKNDLPRSEVDELCKFIRCVSHSTENAPEPWRGDRDMVDLWHLVKRYYYDPATGGSTSLKYVLPAIINSSDFIKNKYSKPIYGASGGITSKNFTDWCWVEYEGDTVRDPYKLLPRLFTDAPTELEDMLSDEDTLANGGAALTAYAKLQFTEMSEFERQELRSALLKYCELDTLAMVMIYEAWSNYISLDAG